MSPVIELLESPARAMGILVAELQAIVQRGQTVRYEPEGCLFHESAPRDWLGIVAEGQVEVVHGLHGRQTHLATLTRGAVLSEAILLDGCAHSTSAFARG